jgi:alkaline phosphatase
LAGAQRSIVHALWDTAVVAVPIEHAPPRVRVAAAAHAAERDQQQDEAAALLERHRAGEHGIVVGVEELLADLSPDAIPPGAAPEK